MGRNSGSVKQGNSVNAVSVSVSEIFQEIKVLNPSVTSSSSLGRYVSQSSQMVVDQAHKEIFQYIPKESNAYKILTGTQQTYTDRQLWAIAYELQKNKKYTKKLGQEIAVRKAREAAKKQASKDKLQANKAGSQGVLDSIKSNGFKLGDYYAWLKKNKKYKREFFSKKYSEESAREFMGK